MSWEKPSSKVIHDAMNVFFHSYRAIRYSTRYYELQVEVFHDSGFFPNLSYGPSFPAGDEIF